MYIMSANLFSRQIFWRVVKTAEAGAKFPYNDLVPFTVCVSSGSYHQRAQPALLNEMQYSKLHLCFSCKDRSALRRLNQIP